ncbi:MAG: porin [Nitrosomonadales bacterium]|nr:porin [Nitrosomonadales bacterium]
MNKKLGMAVAGAVMAFGASAANAGITIPAGDWTIDIGGNVNAYYTNTRYGGDLDVDTDGAPGSDDSNTISTGLLPAALGIGGKTRQNDLDIAFQFTFFTGVDSTDGGGTANVFGANGAGGNSLNIRQAYMTFGDASWGSIKMGRDLGIFGSDAILSDMTLLGVGTGAGGNGNSTLGRIGSGYLYADWVGQISYTSPNWNGFSFAAGARQPWGNSDNNDLGFDGKASYEWTGDMAGKVWVGFLSQKTQTAATAAGFAFNPATGLVDPVAASDAVSERARAWEIGGKMNLAGFGLVGYYYDGKGLGDARVISANLPLSGLLVNSNDQDVDGGYVQGTYVLPGIGTKLGLSWGKSNVDGNAGAADYENESWIVGAYHPLTKSLNLVAEYTDTDYDNINNVRGANGDAKTIALGAILFF